MFRLLLIAICLDVANVVAKSTLSFNYDEVTNMQERRLRFYNVGEEDLQLPMCGFSKVDLEEDPIRRMCLRQCRIEKNGEIRPTFMEWEDYCRETAAMDPWDDECKDYIACTYGCDVWGNRDVEFRLMPPEERYTFMVDTKADIYASGITQEQRCILEKCHSYCVRAILGTCRESQFRQACLDGNPSLYGCDVDCNSADKSSNVKQTFAFLAMTLFSTTVAS